MRKTVLVILFLFGSSLFFCGCRETKEEKAKDDIERVGDEIEEGAERAKEEVEGAYDDVKEELDGETDDN